MNIQTIPDNESVVDTENPLGIELRGYEVAKDNGRTKGERWEVVSKWRPTDFGLRSAQLACDGANRRRTEQGLAPIYAVRPIVSMHPVAPQPAEESKQLELPLEAPRE